MILKMSVCGALNEDGSPCTLLCKGNNILCHVHLSIESFLKRATIRTPLIENWKHQINVNMFTNVFKNPEDEIALLKLEIMHLQSLAVENEMLKAEIDKYIYMSEKMRIERDLVKFENDLFCNLKV